MWQPSILLPTSAVVICGLCLSPTELVWKFLSGFPTSSKLTTLIDAKQNKLNDVNVLKD